MLRFIVRTADVCDAANAGAPVAITYQTFDLINTGLEDFLRENVGPWVKRELVGVELRSHPADALITEHQERSR